MVGKMKYMNVMSKKLTKCRSRRCTCNTWCIRILWQVGKSGDNFFFILKVYSHFFEGKSILTYPSPKKKYLRSHTCLLFSSICPSFFILFSICPLLLSKYKKKNKGSIRLNFGHAKHSLSFTTLQNNNLVL